MNADQIATLKALLGGNLPDEIEQQIARLTEQLSMKAETLGLRYKEARPVRSFSLKNQMAPEIAQSSSTPAADEPEEGDSPFFDDLDSLMESLEDAYEIDEALADEALRAAVSAVSAVVSKAAQKRQKAAQVAVHPHPADAIGAWLEGPVSPAVTRKAPKPAHQYRSVFDALAADLGAA